MKRRQETEGSDQGMTQREVVSRNQPDPNLTKWQLNGSDLLREARKRLQGKVPVYDSDNDELGWKSVGQQILPDEVIDEVINLLNNYVNRNTQLAEFKGREIHKMMYGLKNDLLDYLLGVYEEYREKEEKITTRQVKVAFNISNYVFAALTRAKNGGEKTFLQNTETRTVSMEPGKEESGGMLGKLFPG